MLSLFINPIQCDQNQKYSTRSKDDKISSFVIDIKNRVNELWQKSIIFMKKNVVIIIRRFKKSVVLWIYIKTVKW